jgi:Myotubularin-like phosphatase domain
MSESMEAVPMTTQSELSDLQIRHEDHQTDSESTHAATSNGDTTDISTTDSKSNDTQLVHEEESDQVSELSSTSIATSTAAVGASTTSPSQSPSKSSSSLSSNIVKPKPHTRGNIAGRADTVDVASAAAAAAAVVAATSSSSSSSSSSTKPPSSSSSSSTSAGQIVHHDKKIESSIDVGVTTSDATNLRFHVMKAAAGFLTGESAVLLEVQPEARTVAVYSEKTSKLKYSVPWNMFASVPGKLGSKEDRMVTLSLSHSQKTRRLVFPTRASKLEFLQVISQLQDTELNPSVPSGTHVEPVEFLFGERPVTEWAPVVASVVGSAKLHEGTLWLTQYRMFFHPNTYADPDAAAHHVTLPELELMLATVAEVSQKATVLTVQAKDWHAVSLTLGSMQQTNSLKQLLDRLTHPASADDLFATQHFDASLHRILSNRVGKSESGSIIGAAIQSDTVSASDAAAAADSNTIASTSSSSSIQSSPAPHTRSSSAFVSSSAVGADDLKHPTLLSASPSKTTVSGTNRHSKSNSVSVAFAPHLQRRSNGDALSPEAQLLEQSVPLRFIPSVRDDFARLGLLHSDKWRVTSLNEDYKLCPTYHKTLIVPAQLSDDLISDAANFRSRGRLPVVTWVSPHGCTIARSSQPATGMSRSRSGADEQLIDALRVNGANPSHFVIVDARPKINAVGNQFKGKGYEDPNNYDRCQIRFMGIANIHVVRSSFEAMQSLFETGKNKNWLRRLEESRYLYHIKNILVAARRMADAVHRDHYSLLVHCSDGWDRTAQLTSLAMILLDPYYRTLDGFEMLIQKEWCSFGHKFADRCMQFGVKGVSKERSEFSPVFIQFLDCVHQLLHQFPHSFEFSEPYLKCIAFHVHSGRFGTFMYNCEREREESGILRSTISLFYYLRMHRSQFFNRFYSPVVMTQQESPDGILAPIDAVLRPACDTPHLRVWMGYFGMWGHASHDEIHSSPFDVSILNAMYDDITDQVAYFTEQCETLIQAVRKHAPDLDLSHIIGDISDSAANERAITAAGNRRRHNSVAGADAAVIALQQQVRMLHAELSRVRSSAQDSKDATGASTVFDDTTDLVQVRDAAAGGQPDACYEFGRRYFAGQGVEPDLALAISHWETAANAGHQGALIELGKRFLFTRSNRSADDTALSLQHRSDPSRPAQLSPSAGQGRRNSSANALTIDTRLSSEEHSKDTGLTPSPMRTPVESPDPYARTDATDAHSDTTAQ